jgi:hypothetical protein
LMQSPAERQATMIAGYILSRGLEVISERDIYQNIKSLKGASRDNLAAIQDAMRALELAAWVRPDVTRGNRITTWAINPVVHTKFHSRAKAERERRAATQRSDLDARLHNAVRRASASVLFRSRRPGLDRSPHYAPEQIDQIRALGLAAPPGNAAHRVLKATC